MSSSVDCTPRYYDCGPGCGSWHSLSVVVIVAWMSMAGWAMAIGVVSQMGDDFQASGFGSSYGSNFVEIWT